jgi:hypothetical protein
MTERNGAWSARRGIIGGVALAVLVTGVTVWALRGSDTDTGRTATTADGTSAVTTPSAAGDPSLVPGSPQVERPGPENVETVQANPPYRPIAGSDIPTVVKAWNKHWKTDVKKDDGLAHSAFVDFPAIGGDLQLIALQPEPGPPGAAVAVRCAWEHRPGAVTDAVIAAVVDECLAPALRPGERKPLLSWLVKQDYRGRHNETQRMERFDVLVEELGEATRISLVGHL